MTPSKPRRPRAPRAAHVQLGLFDAIDHDATMARLRRMNRKIDAMVDRIVVEVMR
jgi:hypothetical protein